MPTVVELVQNIRNSPDLFWQPSIPLKLSLPPQTFVGNSPDEIPGAPNYEEVVTAYTQQYHELLSTLLYYGLPIIDLLGDHDLLLAHVCSGFPAKVEALVRVLREIGIDFPAANIVNIDFDSRVEQEHLVYPLTAEMQFFCGSVLEFLASDYCSNERLVIALAVTVTGEVVTQVAEAISQNKGRDFGMQLGFVTTQQVTKRAEPKIWSEMDDYGVVYRWLVSNQPNSGASILPIWSVFSSDRWQDTYSYVVKAKAAL